jgi:site-specific DNA-methyltransferase (adenine-specific)
MACAIEDAGWEIRDSLCWLYGQGFPKSHNLAGEWDGWGTALKPAFEPIILARAPMAERTVAANVQRYGTGAINVDACRIGTDGGGWNGLGSTHDETQWRLNNPDGVQRVSGRWPANVTLDEDAARLLDEMSGIRKSGAMHGEYEGNSSSAVAYSPRGMAPRSIEANEGGASRFFYTAKASSEERNRGLDDLSHEYGYRENGFSDKISSAKNPRGNHHPTVKPVALMQWLCRLITPPGGMVLDPFAGSGTTGIAAMREGFRFVGIEQDAEYAAIARKRIAGDAPLLQGTEAAG